MKVERRRHVNFIVALEIGQFALKAAIYRSQVTIDAIAREDLQIRLDLSQNECRHFRIDTGRLGGENGPTTQIIILRRQLGHCHIGVARGLFLGNFLQDFLVQGFEIGQFGNVSIGAG